MIGMIGKKILAVLKAGRHRLASHWPALGLALLMPSGGSASGPYSAFDQLLVPPGKAFPCNDQHCVGIFCHSIAEVGGRCIQEAGYCFETACNGGS